MPTVYDWMRDSNPTQWAALNKLPTSAATTAKPKTGLAPTPTAVSVPNVDLQKQLSTQMAATASTGKTVGTIKAAPTTVAGTSMAEKSAWKGAIPAQVNDSVADMVKTITSQDSPLMQQARTQGLQVANKRGLLNSSMAVGASQGAVLDKALPIASQDASQGFQKNMAANDFVYRMEGQDDSQAFQAGESFLDRGLQKEMTLTQIASTEGLASAQRQLELVMQNNSITAADRQQLRDISSREGMAAADRALQDLMQTRDLGSRASLAAADRALQQSMQQTEVGYQTSQRGLDRALQEQLASWNLKSTDRNAAAQFLTNMETMYADQYSSVMANQNLDAEQRTAQLAAAKAMRDKQLNFVEQMYAIDLTW